MSRLRGFPQFGDNALLSRQPQAEDYFELLMKSLLPCGTCSGSAQAVKRRIGVEPVREGPS